MSAIGSRAEYVYEDDLTADVCPVMFLVGGITHRPSVLFNKCRRYRKEEEYDQLQCETPLLAEPPVDAQESTFKVFYAFSHRFSRGLVRTFLSMCNMCCNMFIYIWVEYVIFWGAPWSSRLE